MPAALSTLVRLLRPTPALRPRRAGFTVLELVLVLVVVGIVASIVLRKVEDLRERAYIAAMESDLRNALVLEEMHEDSTGHYTDDPATMAQFAFTDGVALLGGRVDQVPSGERLTLVVKHRRTNAVCGVMRSNEEHVATAVHCDPHPQLAIGASQLTPPQPGDRVTFDASQALSHMDLMSGTGAEAGLHAQASPRDSTVRIVAWDFGDGTRVAGPAEQYMVVTHEFDAPTTADTGYQVRLAIVRSDMTVKGALTTVTYQVPPSLDNLDPIAAITVSPSLTVAAGTTVTLSGAGSSDPEGRLSGYFWTFSDGVPATGVSVVKTWAAGTYTAQLTVQDDRGLTDEATVTITVNTAPVAAATATPNPAVAGRTITFDGAASHDADGQALTYSWSIDGVAAATPTVTIATSAAGVLPWTLTVTDPMGATDARAGTVTVVENQAPTATFAVTPPRPNPGTTLHLDARASADADGTIVSYAWSFSDGSTATGPLVDYTPAGGLPDVTTVLTVRDDLGAHGTTAQTTMFNRAPTITATGTPNPALPGQAVTFTATVVDPDGDATTAQWLLDGAPVDGATNLSWSRTFPVGTYAVATQATDAGGLTTTSPPVTLAVTAGTLATPTLDCTPASAPTGTTVTCSAGPVPPINGGTIAYSFSTTGRQSVSGATATYRWAVYGTPTVTVVATDGVGGSSAPASQTLTVTNRAPTASIQVTPPSPTSGQAANFTANASDLDGGTLTYAWDFGDAGYSAAVAPTHTYATPGAKPVSLQVSDGQGGTTTATTILVVQNRAPSADFTASTLTPAAGQTVTFTSTATDPDGIIASLQWLVDGAAVPGATTSPSLTSWSTAGSHTVALRVTDDQGATATSGAQTVTVSAPANATPTVDFTFTPSVPYPSQAVTFTATASDPDGSVASYAWDFKDGATATGASPTHAFAIAGLYAVQVTVTDNGGAQATATRSVTISAASATPPLNVTLSPANLTPKGGQTTTFTGSAQPGSGTIVVYGWRLYTAASSTEPTPTGQVAPTTNNMGPTKSQLWPSSGGYYYMILSVKNSAGLVTTAYSSRIRVCGLSMPGC